MLIRTWSSVSRLLPFAVTPVKLTEPKLVSGKTLEVPEVRDGASAMASAEDRSAPDAVALIVCVQPCVMSLSTSGYQGPAERQRNGGRRNGPFSSHLRSLSHIALAVMKYKQLSTMDNGEYAPFHDRFPPPRYGLS